MSEEAIAVLFATHNGERVLRRTLDAYCALKKPLAKWTLVIVDNASTDSTRAVLKTYLERLPLKIVSCAIPGKNRALNQGLSNVEGALIVLTDDDAVPEPEFLELWSAYLYKNPECDLFGGSIISQFEIEAPAWLRSNRERYDLLFAARDLPEGPIQPDEIYGPNMAVRRSVFQRGLRFYEVIGPNSSDPYYPMGSETDFCRRVAKEGARAWFARGPRVRHLVRREQLSRINWSRRAYRHGRGTAQQMRENGEAISEKSLTLSSLTQLSRRAQMFSPFPARRFDATWDYYWTKGFRDEAKRNTEGNSR